MIISKTPYRISFFGGGTDYPDWYRLEGGAVLSTTIDKYCYITCRFLPPFFNIKHRVVWSHIETVSTISEILHPVVREGLRYLGFDDSEGLEIHHQGDLPARSGIGSSSSFTVGLIKALTALRSGTITKQELALRAIELEQTVLKEKVGCQDQFAAAYGGFNRIIFTRDGDVRVEPVRLAPLRLEELESRLLLFFTGMSRLSSEVAEDFLGGLAAKGQQLRAMRDLVDRGLDVLDDGGSLDRFGRLLAQGWTLKRELGGAVTNALIDKIYRRAVEHGALGGKLLGAGTAGFMVFYVPPHRQAEVIEALSGYLQVPLKFDREGASLVHYNGVASPAVV